MTHHSFDIILAEKYSMAIAILIHHFQHWIRINIKLNRNFHEGKYWTYQTIEEIAAHFPYLSKKQIERLLNKMFELGILQRGNFNKAKFDRTVWYAFKDDSLISKFLESSQHIPKSGNGYSEIGTPIPDTKPDTKAYKEVTKVTKKEETAAIAASSTCVDEVHKNNLSKEKEKTNPEIEEVITLLTKVIEKIRPKILERTNKSKWIKEISLLLKEQSLEEIREVLAWLPTSDFWSINILSPNKLRKNFDRLYLESQLKNKIKNNKEELKERNIEVVKDFQAYLERCHAIAKLQIIGDFAEDVPRGLKITLTAREIGKTLAKWYDLKWED